MPTSDFIGAYDDRTPKSVSIRCRYCAIDVEAVRIGPAALIATGRQQDANIALVAAAYICPRDRCHRLNVVDVEIAIAHYGDETKVVAKMPRGQPRDMDGLPDEVQTDRREAWSCFYGGDHRAAVIMGRAAVRRAARALEAAGAGLKAELNDLASKGTVTSELRDWAHEVRIAGDDAAHPETLGAVKPDEAAESLEFMDSFLEHAVALPKRRAARQAAGKQQGGS